eukprot:scaffold16196_cov31-Cyclotella_meneghiniana.AAC.1
MVLTLARDARHAFCVLWSVVVVQSDVAAFSNNEELWGEMYIGMKVMIMGKRGMTTLAIEDDGGGDDGYALFLCERFPDTTTILDSLKIDPNIKYFR